MTAHQLAEWQRDPPKFLSDCCPPRGSKPGEWRLSGHQERAVRRLLGGGAAHTTLWQWPKRSGKSTLAAGCLAWVSLFRGQGLRSMILSTSERNAGTTIFSELARMVKTGPLEGLAEVRATKATFTPTGSEVLTIPNTEASVTGVTCDGLLTSDELWAAQGNTENGSGEAPFHLLASQTENGQVLLISQAARLGSYIRTLCEAAEAETLPESIHVDRFVPTERALSPNPRLSAAYLRDRERALPANLYRSYFLNEPLSGAEGLFDEDALAACVRGYAMPRTRDEWEDLKASLGGGWWRVASALDRAQPYAKHDQTAFVTAARRMVNADGDDAEETLILRAEVIPFGSAEGVKAARQRALAIFGSHDLRLEAYQCADLQAELGGSLIHATLPVQNSMFTLMLSLVRSGLLGLPMDCLELLDELRRFGCRLGTGELPRWAAISGHDDLVFAAGHAVAQAHEPPPRGIYTSADEMFM